MNLVAGIDVGSSAAKAMLIDDEARVVGKGVTPSGANFCQAAQTVFDHSLREANANREQVRAVAATGYGRNNVSFAALRRTEIDCHARGAFHHFQRSITVVDIGGQDNKIIRLDSQGIRLGFALNRKCAAGTGAFLEEMAMRLKIPVDKLSELAGQSTDSSVQIGSYCTVFAMTEILAKIRQGVRPEDLARAALFSVARRILETEAISGEVVVTGGVVAYNPLLSEMLAQVLKAQVRVAPLPQFMGAFGAALIAREMA